jgi:anti-sigma regulatory factor (Ser/Thr protein kinase)/Fe-S-cluster-containing hydrogenase component 2
VETLRFDIHARDFSAAGAASRALKQHLKRIGAESDSVRRAMIAAYEAEMNVVIHAQGGVLEATVGEHQLDVDVRDEGPGIPDVPAAMREGFSTASAEARALGFGAGLGLPNIERNSDRLRVTSEVGQGTTVSFTVLLRPERSARGERATSLTVLAERCRDCRRCITACPTGAVRVRDAQPLVLQHLCVDCTSCIGVCAPEALTMESATAGSADIADVTLVVPPAVLVDYHPFGDASLVLAALRELGYRDVVVTHGYEEALHAATLARAAGESPLPVVSPVCPAVVALMELRFPALLPYLAPLASPLEAAQLDLPGEEAVFVASCPSQRTALLAQRPTAQRQVMSPAALREAVAPRLAAHDGAGEGHLEGPRPPGSAPDTRATVRAAPDDDVLIVTGADHVIDVLEQLENGLLGGVPVVEPYLCDGGCFGSPLLSGDPYVASWRWAGVGLPAAGRAHERPRSYQPRPGIRLDPDMATAIRKLAELERVTATLPGKDCTVCGAATCAAFAEDIVTGRATRDLCPYAAPDPDRGQRPDEGSTR